MSEFIIKKASKKAKKLRLGLSASSGFGKTYSALQLAYGLTGDWNKICVVDSERDSASLYANLGPYNTIPLNPPYTPERYISAMEAAESAGMEVIIVDSITHEWEGQGGILQIVSDLGGKYQDWKPVTPRHDAFINKILTSKCHVITTVRRKQDHEMTKENGKVTVTKVGLKEQTREGFEYELDVNFEIINDKHLVRASKDRTNLFKDQPEFVITPETGQKIKAWCEQGISNIDQALEEIRNSEDVTKLTSVYNTFKAELSGNPDFVAAVKDKKEKLTNK